MHTDQYALPPLAQRLGQAGLFGHEKWLQASSTPPDDYEETEAERKERQRATRWIEVPPPKDLLTGLDVEKGDRAQEGARRILLWLLNKLGFYTQAQCHAARQNLPGEDQPDTLVGRLEANLAKEPVPQGADDLLAEMKARLQPAKLKGRRP